jgi:hypothetical protein
MFALLIVLVLAFVAVSIVDTPLRENMVTDAGLRIAVVSMIRHPEDFSTWFGYYKNILRVNHFFLRIEDTEDAYEEIHEMLGTFTGVDARFVNNTSDKQDQYRTIQQRQHAWIEESIEACRNLGIDYLIHIDDDEILVVADEYQNDLRVLIHAYRDFVGYANVHFQNIEAVYGPNTKGCFSSRTYVQPSRSYANGKSMGRIGEPGIAADGPHRFTGRSITIPMRDAVVLHYDSCTQRKWESKFLNLIHSKVHDIPFPYYRESIEAVRRRLRDPTPENLQKMEILYRLSTGLVDGVRTLPLDGYSQLIERMKKDNSDGSR